MTETRIESDVVYDHEKHGKVLVTGIAKMYDEWDINVPQEDIESGDTLVYFYYNYDGYGGMNPMPLSETVSEFAKSAEKKHVHEYNNGLHERQEEAIDQFEQSMEEREYENIDPEEYTK